ncbi:zinc-ribbon domain-containing protein, partial [Candidatus Margulisiibacteriota bacterium]
MYRKATTEYNLKIKNPQLATEWHPTKNNILTPENVTPYSNKKVWWQCPKNIDHVWKASIINRNKGSTCPYCLERKVNKDYNLQKINPELAQQWHPIKNGNLTPQDVAPYSRKKVWWQCQKNPHHEWQAIIASRSQGRNCPICSHKILSKFNSLQSINPKLATEWHPTKNGNLTPLDITAGSGKKVWWLCKKNQLHKWQTTVKTRNNGSRCPYCSGRYASKTNNLKFVNPQLAIEWHPTKNGDVTPRDVTRCSGKKVWWQCKKNYRHEWQATIHHRNYGNKCPYCKVDEKHKKKKISINKSIHRKRKKLSLKKENIVFRKKSLIEICPQLASEWHSLKNGSLTPQDVLPYSGKKVWWQCKKDTTHIWEASIAKRTGGHGCPYCSRRYASKKYNLAIVNPKLAKEWHAVKNKRLTPQDVLPYSAKKVWWQCSKNKDHIWFATIAYRSKNTKCPLCNSLQSINPKLFKELHPTKNGNLNPINITPFSNKKVWWQCLKNKNHVWQTTVAKRSYGQKCPFCSWLKVSEDNCLQTLKPDLAAEWHPTKNQDLTPQKITPRSSKKVWWQCKNNKEHIWEANINDRYHGSKCPYCKHPLKPLERNKSLQIVNPKLAAEWHTIKNGKLTPLDVRA